MKSKNLAIVCVWIAIVVIYVLLISLGVTYYNNPGQWLIDMQNDFLVVFVIALVFTGVVVFLKKEQQ